MALADVDDVEAALGSAPTVEVEVLLEEASDLVVGYLGYTPDPVPGAVVRVVAAMVAAVLTQPAGAAGAEQMTAGPFVVRFSADTLGGPWLTKNWRLRLDPYRRTGFISVELGSERATDIDVGS